MMRACTILAISASLALLASANEDDKRRVQLYKEFMNCCKTTKVLVHAFKTGEISCGGQYLMGKASNLYKKLFDPTKLNKKIKEGCLVECIFEENGYLNQDKSLILESEFRDKILAEVEKLRSRSYAAAKDMIDTGLNKCFELVAKNPVPADYSCKSNSQLLLSCFARHILSNCPESDWKEYRNNCKGKRTSFVEEGTALDEKAVAATAALKVVKAQAKHLSS